MRVTCTLLYSFNSCSKTPSARDVVVEHEVLADEPARVRETLRKLRARGHQEQARRLRAVGAHDDGPRSLKALAPIAIEIRDAGRASLLVGVDARDVAVGPHFAAAGRLRFRNDGRQRRRLRRHLAREAVTEAAMDARRPAAIRTAS